MMKPYLGGAASVQNRGAKPWDWFPGERCQGGAAMRCREEAGSLDSASRAHEPTRRASLCYSDEA